jgi:hypothetical protein
MYYNHIKNIIELFEEGGLGDFLSSEASQRVLNTRPDFTQDYQQGIYYFVESTGKSTSAHSKVYDSNIIIYVVLENKSQSEAFVKNESDYLNAIKNIIDKSIRQAGNSNRFTNHSEFKHLEEYNSDSSMSVWELETTYQGVVE